jgi:hypothetical protein
MLKSPQSGLYTKFKILLMMFVVLCSATVRAQQQFGAAQGTIEDSEGQPIPGVTVVVSSELRGSTTAYTDKNGRYSIESLIPGIYQLEVQLTGFQSVLRTDVRISVGSIRTIDFVLKPENVVEYLTVQEETPQIDSTTTAISYPIPPEIIQGLPKTDFTQLLALTPGVGDDLVAYGGSSTSNRIWIDGVDITSRADVVEGAQFVSYDYNWIEEAQVVGNGAPAEYGNFSGVIGNYVTRSGGNQFHGLFETFFHNQNFVSTNVPDPGPEDSFETWDVSTQIGGPIARDKLWFFSGFQFPHTETIPYRYDGVVTHEYPKFITKLTYKPNQNNTIQGFAHYNFSRLDGEGARFEVLPEVTRVKTCHEGSWNATWISLLNEATTLEGHFGGIWEDCKFLPRNGNTPAHINSDTNVQTGNATHTTRQSRFEPQGNFALTHHAENFLGSHEFKFGVQFQNSSTRIERSINGGFIYYSYTYNGSTLNYRVSNLQDTNRFNGDIDQLSLHIHDTWNLNRRLVLSLGLRWDHNRGSTDRGVVHSADPVAPRVGLIWKLRENRPIVIKAHYGDYYDALLLRHFVFLSDQPFGFQQDDFIDGAWRPTLREQFFFFSAPDNKHPFIRQFTVGVDQELPGGIAAGTHYIYRRWHNLLGLIDTNSIYEPVPFPNPVTGDTITVYRQLNPERRLLWTNPEELFRKYDGVEVYLNRQFRKHLTLSASFVYSKTRGNSLNLRENLTTGWFEVLNDPNLLINFSGRLINDPTFAWKFSGIYNLPYGLNLGWFFRHQSGDTWEPLVELSPDLGGVVIFGLPRGSNRLPSQNTLDLRVEKQFPIFTGQIRITADIFNVLNAGTVTAVEPTWELENYGQPIEFVGPRVIRLGLRYTF